MTRRRSGHFEAVLTAARDSSPPVERPSATYRRATSSRLEVVAKYAHDLGKQIASGEVSGRLAAEKVELFSRELDEIAGEVLAQEARS
jgi:hypothetical protein